jgi:hypothetical protein
MSTRNLIAAALGAGMAVLPAAAVSAAPADLQVQASGFNRIVVGSLKGGECHVHHLTNAMSADCTGGASGTLTLYTDAEGAPVCEVDFWYQYTGQGAPKWRAQLSHQNTGSCAIQWVNANSLGITAGGS